MEKQKRNNYSDFSVGLFFKGVFHNCLNFLRHIKAEEKNHKDLENKPADLQRFAIYFFISPAFFVTL